MGNQSGSTFRGIHPSRNSTQTRYATSTGSVAGHAGTFHAISWPRTKIGIKRRRKRSVARRLLSRKSDALWRVDEAVALAGPLILEPSRSRVIEYWLTSYGGPHASPINRG